jgi:hypothetical protein
VPSNLVNQTFTNNTTVNITVNTAFDSGLLNYTKNLTLIFAIFYLLFIIISIYSLHAFKTNYEYGSIKTKKRIIVKSVSNGSQEAVSYLITIIVPLMSRYSVFSAFPDDSIGFLATLIIFVFIYAIYVNSNLIAVNPMLLFIDYSINKINFSYVNNPEVEFEGVLLSKRELDLTIMTPETIMSEIDTNTFIYRRI